MSRILATLIAMRLHLAAISSRLDGKWATMFLKSLHLKSFLSFGSDCPPVELGPLNVIIGANGTGKSNFIEAIDLLRAAPSVSESLNARAAVRDGGGVREWIWKGAKDDSGASIEAVLECPRKRANLRYRMRFADAGKYRFKIREEIVEDVGPGKKGSEPKIYYRLVDGKGIRKEGKRYRKFMDDEIDAGISLLARHKDPERYPELAKIGETFESMRIYREWHFGRDSVARMPQMADLPDARLAPDASNLGLVLNRLRREPASKERFLHALRKLYDGIDDFDLQIEGGALQIFIQEGRNLVPAKRLSDATLRYLCLLAVLCHPDPGPLICIEEPELGMHPDILVALADLLVEASEKAQLVVTTHSEILVDAMTKRPESIFVAERDSNGTRLERLEDDEIKPWLEEYGDSLGECWMQGHIGGLRW